MGKYSIAMSAVEWTSTSTPNGPVYNPVLAWRTSLFALAPTETFAGRYDTSLIRTCGGALNQVDTVPSDSSILTSIPTKNVSTPSTLVLVDIHYQFSPILPVTFIIGSIDFYTTFMFPNLIGQNTQPLDYDWANPADSALCIPNSGVDG